MRIFTLREAWYGYDMPRRAREPAHAKRERTILRATIEELARADYGGLTFEHVAARAGVNKTTVYRRWPTKVELVRAALMSVAQTYRVASTTGSLRGDLMQFGRATREFLGSFEGQCLLRVRLLHHPEPALAAMATELHARNVGDIDALGRAAVERGEIRSAADFGLLLEMLAGALHTRLIMKDEAVDDVAIARFVDVLLAGALEKVNPARRSLGQKRRPRPRR